MANKKAVAEDSVKACHFTLGREEPVLPKAMKLEQLPFESARLCESRNELFTECWTNINNKIQEIVDEEHKEVIENVLQYVCHSKEKLAQLSSAIPGGDQRHLHLFTAALMAGVSLADHQALFSPLVEALKSSATPHLATLRSRSCNSGMKAIVKSIIAQLMLAEDQVFSEEEEEEELSMPRSVRKRVRTPGGRKTPKQARGGGEDAGDDLQRPVSKRRKILFGSPGTSAGASVSCKKTPSQEKTLEEEQKTPRSSRGTRLDGGLKTPERILTADGKLNRTPRSKKGESSCRTPITSRGVAATPSRGLTTPRSSRRGWGEDVSGTPRSTRPTTRMKRPQCSMSTLCAWYRETSQKEDCREPVVLFIEDFEEFSSKVLQDLILSLVPRLQEFPVVLVLGMAVPASVLYQTLPHHASSHLSIQQFSMQPPSLTYSRIVSEVLMSPDFPFKLGPRTFNFLKDQFFLSNLSLAALTRGLKLALMEHFHWQPLSVLCSESILKGQSWPSLPKGFCESVRATPSFQRHVESLPAAERTSLLTEDKGLTTAVKEMIKEVWHCQQATQPLLLCLHHLTSSLPDAPLGSKVHDLYCASLEQKITEHCRFKEAWTLLNMLGKDHLNRLVHRCIASLRRAETSGVRPPLLRNALRVFTRYEEEVEQLSIVVREEGPVVSCGEDKEPVRRLGVTPSFKKSFEGLRKSFLSHLLSVYTDLLSPFGLVLHEAFYFDQVASLQSHLASAPAISLQRALTDHTHYLSQPQPKKRRRGSSDSAPVPDLCILYDLYLESSKLISISDWLQSFAAVVDPAGRYIKKGPTDEDTKRNVDPVIHNRFNQALSELQLLGYVRQTQRKADHLQRLTIEHSKDEYSL